MTVPSGSRLGPYEIVALLGAGGMGEVYRAKDPRLGREVAIKVLPPSFSADADRLRRFEQEARAAGVLNHPNITAVYDIGTNASDGAPYVVQELLEGETLRTALSGGKLSQRRAIDYSLQIAHGLAAAHEKGIVHRDLKPENLFVTKDGRVKILDFGLAKLTHLEEGSQATNLPTAAAGTEPGVVLGTLGYMSPEQVRGRQADVRSDIFSFGAILYEMLSGKRAFHGDSAADTMSAILREDPPDLSVTNQNVSPGLDRVVRHCLEKNPEQRFHSAHDVAFALETLSGTSAPTAVLPGRAPARARSRALPFAIGAVLLAAGVAAGFLFRDLSRKTAPPSFKRLTFRQGTVWTARFAPDGQTVVYSAAWENNPIEVYLTRPESPESRPLGLRNVSLLDVSSTGELAVMLDARTTANAYERSGTLARMPLAGGSPRPVMENVRYADWTPDGRELMVERAAGNKHVIEFPPGKVIYETTGRINTPRLSPRADAIAFFESGGTLGQGQGRTSIRVVDLSGKARTLVSMSDWWNLAWSPDGKEIWYAAPEPGQPVAFESLQAVTLSGKRRLLLRFPGILEFHDVSRDGRVLLARVGLRPEVIGLPPGESKERMLTWLDASVAVDLSRDGKILLISEVGEGGGANQSIYLRKTDGSPATLIGEGVARSLSPDGRWVLATAPTTPRQLVLLPTGPGAPRVLKFDGVSAEAGAIFSPDGKIFLQDNPAGQPPQLLVATVEGGKPRPLAPKGFKATPFGAPVSPDGSLSAVLDAEGKVFLCPTKGGSLKPLVNLERGEFPIQWSEDSRFLYTHRGGELPARVWRYEIATSRKELFKELSPADPAGVAAIETILLTPDGRSYVYSYSHNLSDLYIVDGVK